MILVVGLAVAGLVGIAAAFFFSIRSGDKRDRGAPAARSGRAGADGLPPGRAGVSRPDRPRAHGRGPDGDRPANAGRTPDRSARNYRAEGDGGTTAVMDFGDPALSGGRRSAGAATGPRAAGRRVGDRAADPLADRGNGRSPSDRSAGSRSPSDRPAGSRPADRAGATGPRATIRPGQQAPSVPAPAFAAGRNDDTPGDPWPGDPQPADSRLGDSRLGDSQPTDPRLAAKVTKPRRRVGFRKGADVDEEMWPLEAFGGVSDEQFWDEMASDKPLTTTARTAQQDPGPRNSLLDAAPKPDARAAGQPQGAVRPRGEDNDRTVVQPAYAATQPVQSLQPVQGLKPQAQPGTGRPVPAPVAPVTAIGPATPLTPVASAPVSAADKPAEGRRRRHASPSTEEDPLTSAAYALRSSGPVDGSSFRNTSRSREPYDATTVPSRSSGSRSSGSSGPGTGPASPYGGTPPYPYPTKPYTDSTAVTQANAATPPYGENYGYGSPAAQPEDSRPQNGARRHARHGGHDEGSRAPRLAYPQGSYQGNGSNGNGSHGGYQGANGYQSGNHRADAYQTGGYPGNGYPGGPQGRGPQGNGHRAPYDPREDYRRLTAQC